MLHLMIDRLECTRCGSKDRLVKHNKSKNFQYYWCSACNSKRMREYRKTPSGRKSMLRSVKKYERENHERTLAWRSAHNHNKIQLPCIICGKLPSQMHHPDIHQRLNVVFLCAYHHKQADKQSSRIKT